MIFSYDSGFVVLSIAVAILGAFTGLVMMTGIKGVSHAQARLRICLGGLGIGGGVWSMHFIAMLAVKLPIPLSYDVTQTAEAKRRLALTFGVDPSSVKITIEA